jgi:hypothetical protein
VAGGDSLEEVVKVPITATIKRPDGTLHVYRYEGESEGVDYLWNEGNYSCDCNRAQFCGDIDIDDENKCSEGKYELVSLGVGSVR